MAKTIIGVMGPGDGATPENIQQATKIGKLIAQEGWVLLTGGRNVGVMDAASKGAQQSGGLTIGILPSANRNGMSEFIDIPICTGMGSARNNINVLSSDVTIGCGSGAGTTSEIMLAMKAQKPIVLLNPSPQLIDFVDELPYENPPTASSAAESIGIIRNLL